MTRTSTATRKRPCRSRSTPSAAGTFSRWTASAKTTCTACTSTRVRSTMRRLAGKEDRRHLLVDQRQRLWRLRRAGHGHRAHAGSARRDRSPCCSTTSRGCHQGRRDQERFARHDGQRRRAGVGRAAIESGPISRGYKEEMEHWGWCIRNPSDDHRPRCHPKVALADAVIALTTNIAHSQPRAPANRLQARVVRSQQ